MDETSNQSAGGRRVPFAYRKEEVLIDVTSNQSADAGGRRVPFAYRIEEVLMDKTSNQSADGRRESLACKNE